MSIDLETRRLVRALLHSGVDVEDVLSVVIDEVVKLGGHLPNLRVEQSAREGTVIRFMPGRMAPVREEPAAVVPGSEVEHAGPPVVVNGEDVEDDEMRPDGHHPWCELPAIHEGPCEYVLDHEADHRDSDAL